MSRDLSRAEYDAVTAAAETYRAALVVRLAGEAGLRTGEIPRVRPGGLRESSTPGAFLLAVPAAEDHGDDGRGGDDAAVDREAFVPASLAAELRRYADGRNLDDSEPFVDVSTRRVQMLVNETAERAAERMDRPALADLTPRDLRRFFARRHLDDGANPHAVREAGGWETLGALDRHLDPLSGEAVAAALGDGSAGEAAPADEAAPAGEAESADSAETTTAGIVGALDAVADATDRESLLDGLVDRLTATDRWAAAWVVERGHGAAPGVAAAAGDVPSDGERRRFEPESGDESVALGAVDTPLTGTVSSPDGDRTRPALAVPVAYHDATYATLCVAGDRPTMADRRAVTAIARTAGRALTSFRWRDLLHSDAVTEVEFRVDDRTAFLARLSADLDCRVEVAATVAVGEALRCYLDVTGADAHAVADVVEASPSASDLGLVEAREDGCAVSVLIAGESAVHALTEHGATVRTATAEDGQVRVIADVPDGTDVRPVAAGLREQFPDARLASKESTVRPPDTAAGLREDVADRLTDRQQAALSAAYHGGYFDWPRGSTAEEVADAMGVSSPTFHNHLRKAQRALLDALFEGDDGVEDAGADTTASLGASDRE
ncbi:bacterio-opsin activator domain-containing protein [Halorubrum gandharaense]